MLQKFLEKAYSEVTDNIKFSEAKNVALITLNSALIGTGAGKVFEYEIALKWRILIAFLLLLFIVPTVLSLLSFRAKTDNEIGIVKSIYSFIDNRNQINEQPVKLMFYSYIAKHYKSLTDVDKYLSNIGSIDEVGAYERQMASQIIDLAGVAYRKFMLFNFAIKLECIIFSVGGLAAFAVVISKLIF